MRLNTAVPSVMYRMTTLPVAAEEDHGLKHPVLYWSGRCGFRTVNLATHYTSPRHTCTLMKPHHTRMRAHIHNTHMVYTLHKRITSLHYTLGSLTLVPITLHRAMNPYHMYLPLVELVYTLTQAYYFTLLHFNTSIHSSFTATELNPVMWALESNLTGGPPLCCPVSAHCPCSIPDCRGQQTRAADGAPQAERCAEGSGPEGGEPPMDSSPPVDITPHGHSSNV